MWAGRDRAIDAALACWFGLKWLLVNAEDHARSNNRLQTDDPLSRRLQVDGTDANPLGATGAPARRG